MQNAIIADKNCFDPEAERDIDWRMRIRFSALSLPTATCVWMISGSRLSEVHLIGYWTLVTDDVLSSIWLIELVNTDV